MSRTGQTPPGAADGSAAILVRTLTLPPGTRFSTHAHAPHQILWARSGVLTVATEAGSWVLPPTRALWIPARLPHRTAASGGATMRALYLDPAPGLPGWTAPQPVAVAPLVAVLIDHLADDTLEPPRRARAQAVLIDNLAPVASATIDAPMPTDPRALDVARALTEHPADPRTLDQWGRQVGASARTLARAFAADTGLSFAQWRTTLRIRAALPHLAEGLPIATVARRVGYSTPSAFVAAFRRETGLTPGSYFH